MTIIFNYTCSEVKKKKIYEVIKTLFIRLIL